MDFPVSFILMSTIFTGVADAGSVEIIMSEAVTDSEKKQGLMDVESMDKHESMIFVWENEDDRSMWMKNTRIPLDMVFIDENLRIVNIERADPEPGVEQSDLEIYISEEPSQYVLETNQNVFDEELEGNKLEIRRWKGENFLDLYS